MFGLFGKRKPPEQKTCPRCQCTRVGVYCSRCGWADKSHAAYVPAAITAMDVARAQHNRDVNQILQMFITGKPHGPPQPLRYPERVPWTHLWRG